MLGHYGKELDYGIKIMVTRRTIQWNHLKMKCYVDINKKMNDMNEDLHNFMEQKKGFTMGAKDYLTMFSFSMYHHDYWREKIVSCF